LSPVRVGNTAKLITTIVLAVVVGVGGIFALNRAWDARDNNPGQVIHGWAEWNYSGYEMKPYPDPTHQYKTSQEYFALMAAMNQLAAQYGNGRLLWEPGDALNTYGTTLSPELIPYFTDGKIDSMEGLYFESSATTDYHFQTVAECGVHPSNPVRGLVYKAYSTDFDLCVKHLQMLGVRYLMLWTKEAEAKADASKDLTPVMTIPDIDGLDPKGWKVYEVSDSAQAVGLSVQPVVVKTHGGKYSKCWNTPYNDPTTPEIKFGGWECTSAPWFDTRSELGIAWTASGPKDWQRIDSSQLASFHPQPITPATVSNYKSDPYSISFDVSEVGKPIEVKTSYFPNWKVSGAKGPYRMAPNLMIVIPTSTHVKLTYGLTKADWIGRLLTLLGIAGVVGLVIWKGAVRYAGDPSTNQDADATDDDSYESDDTDEPHEPDEPEEQKEPEPALP
jgi:hypothetical protein